VLWIFYSQEQSRSFRHLPLLICRAAFSLGQLMAVNRSHAPVFWNQLHPTLSHSSDTSEVSFSVSVNVINSYIQSSIALHPLLGPGPFFSFVIFFTQTVGLLGRVIRKCQTAYNYTCENMSPSPAQISSCSHYNRHAVWKHFIAQKPQYCARLSN
jgi:hypothetical protein